MLATMRRKVDISKPSACRSALKVVYLKKKIIMSRLCC